MDFEELIELRDTALENASEFRKMHYEKEKTFELKNQQVLGQKAARNLDRQTSQDYLDQIQSATEPNEVFKTHQDGYTIKAISRPPPPPQAVLPYDPTHEKAEEVSDLY